MKFNIGEGVQYFDEGWRYAIIVELPIKGAHKGEARLQFGKANPFWVPIKELVKL